MGTDAAGIAGVGRTRWRIRTDAHGVEVIAESQCPCERPGKRVGEVGAVRRGRAVEHPGKGHDTGRIGSDIGQR